MSPNHGTSSDLTEIYDLNKKCTRPAAKVGGFGLQLKSGLIGTSADLHHLKVIFGLRWLLRINVFLPNFVGYSPATSTPVAPRP